MGENATTARIGELEMTLFNAGDLIFDVGKELAVPQQEWREQDYAIFEKPLLVPVLCVLIQSPETTVLVDAGAYELVSEPETAPPGYVQPPSLVRQLAAAGKQTEDIQHIVITHAHFDHFNGLTQIGEQGEPAPTYPNAVVYLGKGDWENEEMQRLLRSPDSLQAQTLGFLHDQGMLRLVDAQVEIAPGIEIVPTPGETPGHVAVRVVSEGRVGYCLGDLYHHVVEVEKPQWEVTWADKQAIENSRRLIARAALKEDALVTASHIPGFGRIRASSDGLRWETVWHPV